MAEEGGSGSLRVGMSHFVHRAKGGRVIDQPSPPKQIREGGTEGRAHAPFV